MVEPFSHWAKTPFGQYIVNWELAIIDQLAETVFGDIALQIGLPDVDFLRSSSIANQHHASHDAMTGQLVLEGTHWPVRDNEFDLIILAHGLEESKNPELLLSEALRVLSQQGSLIIVGLNPHSFLGLRRRLSLFLLRQGRENACLHSVNQIKSWCNHLELMVSRSAIGCYCLPVQDRNFLEKVAFLDNCGDRWWPMFGCAYVFHAVKYVQGMMLIKPGWQFSPGKSDLLPVSCSVE